VKKYVEDTQEAKLKERKKGWREEGTEGEGKKRGSDLPD
jgi:hypothetical protein